MKYKIFVWLEGVAEPVVITSASKKVADAVSKFEPAERHLLDNTARFNIEPGPGDGDFEPTIRLDPRTIIGVIVQRVE